MRIIKFFLAFLLLINFASCVVERPPYTKIEQVLTLHTGMSKEEVSTVLGIPPYDLKLSTDTQTILIYKYRVTNRKTLPFFVKPSNGLKVTGKYVDLFVSYNVNGKATKIESCSECGSTEEKKTQLDVNRLILLLSVIAPAVLVYLGIKNTTP